MPFKKGQGGRKPGATNLFNRNVKEMVINVFNELQNDEETNLSAFARKYPKEFHIGLVAKIIPTEIEGSLKQVIHVSRGTKLDQEDVDGGQD